MILKYFFSAVLFGAAFAFSPVSAQEESETLAPQPAEETSATVEDTAEQTPEAPAAAGGEKAAVAMLQQGTEKATEIVITELQKKQAIILESYPNLPVKTLEAFMEAAQSMSVEDLDGFIHHNYVSGNEHNAYDGHTVLEHAKMHARFAPPLDHKTCPECGDIVFNLARPDAHGHVPHGTYAAWSNHYTDKGPQFSRFPIPLKVYAPAEKEMNLWEKLCHRVQCDPFNLAATLIFLFAIIHTFVAPKFQQLAHNLEHSHRQQLREQKFRILHPEQRMPVSFVSTLCHFLGEVEVVFGLWIIPFALVCQHYYSWEDFLLYIDRDTSFTEPLFVAVVMVIASSRPIYRLAENTLKFGASMGGATPAAWWLSVLCIAPLLGSFITEPAAMTLAAILLAKKFYQLKPCMPLRYATIALLFVNVSVGGTLTHFAAPPIVMVAGKWDWNMLHMFTHFGWKAIVGIALANCIYFFAFRKEFKRLEEVQRINSAFDGQVPNTWEDRQDIIPFWVYIVSICFLAWTVYFAHHPAIFIAGFLFFLGFTMATPQYQNAFSIKVPLLVAFFLAGLLIMGGVQGWWMQPVLQGLAELGGETTMALASILTAFNDNASVTFLSSTVPDLAENIKYSIVAGAVTGGGLTVIANAPNPAGQAILGKYFKGISALQLFLWAIVPTVIMFCMFNFVHFGE